MVNVLNYAVVILIGQLSDNIDIVEYYLKVNNCYKTKKYSLSNKEEPFWSSSHLLISVAPANIKYSKGFVI